MLIWLVMDDWMWVNRCVNGRLTIKTANLKQRENKRSYSLCFQSAQMTRNYQRYNSSELKVCAFFSRDLEKFEYQGQVLFPVSSTPVIRIAVFVVGFQLNVLRVAISKFQLKLFMESAIIIISNAHFTFSNEIRCQLHSLDNQILESIVLIKNSQITFVRKDESNGVKAGNTTHSIVIATMGLLDAKYW